MNGAHFRTDGDVAPEFKTKKLVNGSDRSGQPDREVFAEGMVVTVRHGSGDNNASGIEYRDNLQGPVARVLPGVDNVLEILGQTVVVDNAAVFASIKQNDVVEVSGYVDNAGRIRASRLFSLPPPLPPPAQEFELKGFVSGSSSTGFRLGPLPDASGITVMVFFPPGGPANGAYVQVATTDREPVAGSITATRVATLAARTEFPDNALVDLEGLVTTPWNGQGNDLSFAVEGKRVLWEAGTEFGGGARRRPPANRSESAGPWDGKRRSPIRRPNRFPIGKSVRRAYGNDRGGEHEFLRNGCRRCPGVRLHALVADIAWVGFGRVGDVVPEEDLSPARRGRQRSASPSHPPRISPSGRSSRQRPRRRPGRHPLSRPRHPSTTSG